MFKTTISVNGDLDIEKSLEVVHKGLENERQGGASDTVVDECRAVISQFLDQGDRLLRAGSSMHATRRIEGSDFSITIIAIFGESESWLTRLISRIRLRG